jgi:hypothetical protein
VVEGRTRGLGGIGFVRQGEGAGETLESTRVRVCLDMLAFPAILPCVTVKFARDSLSAVTLSVLTYCLQAGQTASNSSTLPAVPYPLQST